MSVASAVLSVLQTARTVYDRAVLGITYVRKPERDALAKAFQELEGVDVALILAGVKPPQTPAPNVPSPAADTQAPTVPTGISAVTTTTSATFTGDWSADNYQGVGIPVSGIKQINVYSVSAGLLGSVSAPGIGTTSQYTGFKIGTGTVGDSTQSGNGSTLRSDGTGTSPSTDNLWFDYRTVAAHTPFTYTHRIDSISCADTNGQNGMMIRSSTASNAAMVASIARQNGLNMGVITRPTDAGTAVGVDATNPNVGPPLYNRFTRDASDNLSVAVSTDGQTFTTISTQPDPTAGGTALIGDYTASKTNGTISTTVISNRCLSLYARWSYADPRTLTANTTYQYLFEAEDVAGNKSAKTAGFFATTVSTGAAWPASDTKSPLFQGWPNTGAFATRGGYQAGAVHGWINDLSDTGGSPVAWSGHSGHFRGTFLQFLYGSYGGSSPVQLRSLTSGRILTTGQRNLNRGKFSMNFASAPGYGVYGSPNLELIHNALDVTLKHFDGAMDDSGTEAQKDNRDAIGYTNSAGNCVTQYCSFRWSCDEVVDTTSVTTLLPNALVNCMLTEPLSASGRTGDKKYHGYISIAGYDAPPFTIGRSYMAHTNGRAPQLSKMPGLNILDTLVYNKGYRDTDTATFEGGLEITGSDTGRATTGNATGNMCIAGPNTHGTQPIQINGAGVGLAFGGGSQFYLGDNIAYDPLGRFWTYSQVNQANLTAQAGTIPGGFLAGSLITSIAITGYHSLVVPLDGGGHPIVSSILAKVALLSSDSGSRPGARLPTGRDIVVAEQCRNFIQQTGSNYGRIIDSPNDVGGSFTVPVVAITDPFDPTAFGGDPFPSDPDTMVTCADGVSRPKSLIWDFRREAAVGCPAYGQP